MVRKIFRMTVVSINEDDKACCEAIRDVLDLRISETDHLDQSRKTSGFIKPFFGRKSNSNKFVGLKTWYTTKELKGFHYKLIMNILDNISSHVKIPEELNVVKELEFYHAKAKNFLILLR